MRRTVDLIDSKCYLVTTFNGTGFTMNEENKQLVGDFFAAIARGELPDAIVTGDMTAWTLTSGEFPKERFAMGVKLLSAIFDGTLHYHLDAITAEENRVVVEAHSTGTLVNGEDFHNLHVFAFTIRDGRIASVREYMNPIIVAEQLAPLLREAASGTGSR